jgi:peptidoglycan/xylan/chitin deacetylase (PgdA/CDA1 family)
MTNAALKASWQLPMIRTVSSRRPVILLYHDTPAAPCQASLDRAVFERHVQFLTEHFDVLSAGDGWKRRRARDRIRVLVTFDDGFRNNAEVAVPILRKYRVPAVFFVCSRHATPGRYLWFSYLRALERHFRGNGFTFRTEFMDMAPARRCATVGRLRELLLNLQPHPSAMYAAIENELPRLEDFVCRGELDDRYAGMTEEQVQEIAADPLFDVGVHTADHPFLTKCSPDEATRQIETNQSWIERQMSRSCRAIAYPSGDYNGQVLDSCARLGISEGYAVAPRLKGRRELQLPRIGVYSAELDVLGFKVQWGNTLRALRVRVG